MQSKKYKGSNFDKKKRKKALMHNISSKSKQKSVSTIRTHWISTVGDKKKLAEVCTLWHANVAIV